MLPSMLRKRRGVMKTKKVSNDYLLSIMTPLWDRAFLKAKLRKLFRG
jgi:hypothetical protein